MKRVCFILTIIILTGCSKDPHEDYDLTNKESANLIFEPYFEQFKDEAEKRGYDFRDYNIEFYLADINGESAVGIGNYTAKEIIIDRYYWNWNQIDSNRKAFLVFHELGHAILKREHTNKRTESQECLSFMRDRTHSDKCQLNYYSELWKDIYFDELFDQNSPLPNWYKNNQVYNFTYESKQLLFEDLDNDNKMSEIDIDTDTISNFVLEVKFKNWESTSENAPYRNAKINLNGINFETNPNGNVVYISNNDYSKPYFSKRNYNYEEDIKLTIRRNHEIYTFFIDENLVHITDIESLETENIDIEFSEGVNKDIILFKFN